MPNIKAITYVHAVQFDLVRHSFSLARRKPRIAREGASPSLRAPPAGSAEAQTRAQG